MNRRSTSSSRNHAIYVSVCVSDSTDRGGILCRGVWCPMRTSSSSPDGDGPFLCRRCESRDATTGELFRASRSTDSGSGNIGPPVHRVHTNSMLAQRIVDFVVSRLQIRSLLCYFPSSSLLFFFFFYFYLYCRTVNLRCQNWTIPRIEMVVERVVKDANERVV